MALKIRLRKQGRSNHATFRLVVTDARSPRDGKYVEMLGWYDPQLENSKNVSLHTDRISYWLDHGAQLTEKAEKLVARAAPEIIKALHTKKTGKKKKVGKKSPKKDAN